MRKLIAATIVFLSLFASTYSHASVADEIHYLSMAIYYEAEGENMKGKEAVADVIINRMKHPEFGKSIKSVVTAKGQFQWYHNHRLRKGRVFDPVREIEIVKLAQRKYLENLLGIRRDTVRQAVFFSTGKKPAKRARVSQRIGNHVFFKLTDA